MYQLSVCSWQTAVVYKWQSDVHGPWMWPLTFQYGQKIHILYGVEGWIWVNVCIKYQPRPLFYLISLCVEKSKCSLWCHQSVVLISHQPTTTFQLEQYSQSSHLVQNQRSVLIWYHPLLIEHSVDQNIRFWCESLETWWLGRGYFRLSSPPWGNRLYVWQWLHSGWDRYQLG